ncbi:regulator [Polaribacter sp. SA4-10]|uniref:choice-of-anchor B family protein n=1 Tax=Polaribacter sp. SA4-10 TaxID=754397 RepID=UPI000B3CE2A3|nr:choice-of-anchor B family protein [Polaribacter sp. SA4-10]ARV07068.1 regulator [Polaribacter sp. SA4-10]
MKKITFIFFLLTQIIFAQTPCIDGFAGEYPCNDYDLMSHISNATLGNLSTAGNDSWGWTDPDTQKEYALMGIDTGIVFIDISNPIEPIIIGTLSSSTVSSSWRDVKVYNSHAFIVSEANSHGMQVFDLRRLRNPSNAIIPFTADTTFTGFGSAHNIVINEESGYAYIVGASRSSTYGGGPIFINIQDPVNPVIEGGFAEGGYSHDAQVITYSGPDTDYTNKEILIGSNENEIVIADVTDKTNPIVISTISYSNVKYAHQGWFTDDLKYFILGDEQDELKIGNKTRSIIFDFTDLDNPVYHFDYFGNTNAIDHNGYVKDNVYYQANYTGGVRMIDVSNIATKSFSEIGFFDTYPNNDNADFNGVWNVYPYFPSGNIIVSDIDNGFFVIRKSGTLNVAPKKALTNFSVFPNPAKSQTTITIGNNKIIESVQVYSILGQKIIDKKNLKQPKYILKTAILNKGIYLIKINGKMTKKFIIE